MKKHCAYCGEIKYIIKDDDHIGYICKHCKSYKDRRKIFALQEIAKARLKKARQIRKMNEEKDDIVIKKWEDPFIKNKK